MSTSTIIEHVNGAVVRPAAPWKIPAFWPARPRDVQVTPLPCLKGVISAPASLWVLAGHEVALRQPLAQHDPQVTRVLWLWEIYAALKGMTA